MDALVVRGAHSACRGWLAIGALLSTASLIAVAAEPAAAQDDALFEGDPLGDETEGESETETETETETEAETGTEAEADLGVELEAEAETGEVVQEQGTGLFEESLGGEVDSGASDAGSSAFDLDGYVRSDVFVGVPPSTGYGEIQAGYGELSLQINGPREPYGSAYAEARMRYGKQLDVQDLILELREAYVDLYAGPLDLRLGQQIIVWGRADAFNPTNNLMPFDARIRSPIEDDRRVGNLAARAFVNFAPVRIEGVWIPLFIPAEYPPIPPAEYVVVLDPDFPEARLQDGLFAGRVHLELPEVEGSLSYVNGYAPLPGLGLQSYSIGTEPPLGAVPAEVRIARTAYRQHVLGGDFSTAVSDLFALRGEVAYRHPIDYQNRVYAARPDLQYVLGGDVTFGSVNLIAQYMGRYVFDWEKEDGPEDPIDASALETLMPPLPQFVEERTETNLEDQLAQRNQILFSQIAELQHLVTLRVQWQTMHDTLVLSIVGMNNFTTGEWLAFPKVEYRFSDSLTGYVGGEIYYGPTNTLLNFIDHQLTAGYMELRYSF